MSKLKIQLNLSQNQKKSIEINNLIINYIKKYSELKCKLHRNQIAYNLQKSKSYIYKILKEENPYLSLSFDKFYK